eukprot:UN04638
MVELNELLGKQRFILGDKFSEADIRACVVLFRWDLVFAVSWKCTFGTLVGRFTNLYAYLHDIYQNVFTTPELKQANQFVHILLLSYPAKLEFNPSGIIPVTALPDYTKPFERKF